MIPDCLSKLSSQIKLVIDQNSLAKTLHPELYPNLIRNFDLLTEFITGPSLPNQTLLKKNFTPED